jgi:GcrA cell cycle regulator
MARINPTFYPETGTWETDDGVSAKSVAALKAKLGRGATIENYYPNGFGHIPRPRSKSSSIYEQSVAEAVAAIARRNGIEPRPETVARDLVSAGEDEFDFGEVSLPEDIKVIPEVPIETKVETNVEEPPPVEPEDKPDAPLAPGPEFDPYVKEPEPELEPVEAITIEVPEFIPSKCIPLKVKKVSKRERPKRKPTWAHDKRKLEAYKFPKVDWGMKEPGLVRMFREGLSVSEIARGIPCSQNAVIGRLHRLGYKISRR